MPLLILYYLLAAEEPDMLVVAALTAGFLGDVFLMCKGVSLALGIASFLVGHILYICKFLGSIRSVSLNAGLLLAILTFAAYGVLLFRYLKPHTGRIRILLIPYSTVLLAMGFIAFLYFGTHPDWKGIMVFSGAVFFIASDSLLSFELFRKARKWRTVSVMATYTLAQGLLVSGLL